MTSTKSQKQELSSESSNLEYCPQSLIPRARKTVNIVRYLGIVEADRFTQFFRFWPKAAPNFARYSLI
jgi:hypothetical protein